MKRGSQVRKTLHSQPTANSACVSDILIRGTERLIKAHIEEARLLCEHMLSHILATGRLDLYLKARERVSSRQIRSFEKGIARLAEGEPIQYVTGFADFMGRRFKVNRHCLIPRPETEELVDWALGFASLRRKPKPLIADVGTGSGCIVVTLSIEMPGAGYIAIDINKKALELAKVNAAAHGVILKIQFKTGDLLSGIRAASLDAVISNPPYVRTGDFVRLARQVREHEPRVALDAGERGLDIIAPLIVQAFHALKPEGFLFMEIGEEQWQDVKQLLSRAGFSNSIVKKDLSGRNRMVRAEKRTPKKAVDHRIRR